MSGKRAATRPARRRPGFVLAGFLVVLLALVGTLVVLLRPGAAPAPGSVSAAASPSSDAAGSSSGAPSPEAPSSVAPPSSASAAALPAAAAGAPAPAAQVRRRKAARVIDAGPPLRRLTPEEVAEIALRKAARRAARLRTESTFRIATLNVLGSQHRAGGTSRAAREAELIRAQGIDVIGLQEVQPDQQAVFVDRLPGYTVWPRHTLGTQGYRLQLAWRADRFELVDTGARTHTFDSTQVPLPYVRLRDRETGAEFFVIDAHNSPRDMQGQREASTRIESSLVNELESTGLAVLLVGDFNEHEQFFCRIAPSTGLVSANGGYWSGGCRPPSRDRMRIDWILGSGGRVEFDDYVQDDVTRQRGLSDHSLIRADVTVTDPGTR
jgi:endonuclease/exonuclease/phosphatase family metal-dependent hydrolase